MAKVPTPAQLRALLSYDPLGGTLTWLARPREMFATHNSFATWNSRFAGKEAGCRRKDGYVEVRVFGAKFYAHRIAWAIAHGEWPEFEIDHEDTDPSNNRIRNLRDVGHQTNLQNRRRSQRNSSTGVLGVYPSANGKRFISQIGSDSGSRYLGTFDTADLAHDAFLAVKRDTQPGCTL